MKGILLAAMMMGGMASMGSESTSPGIDLSVNEAQRKMFQKPIKLSKKAKAKLKKG